MSCIVARNFWYPASRSVSWSILASMTPWQLPPCIVYLVSSHCLFTLPSPFLLLPSSALQVFLHSVDGKMLGCHGQHAWLYISMSWTVITIVLTSFEDRRNHSIIPAHPPLSWSYTKLLYHQQISAYCLLSNLEDHSRTVKTIGPRTDPCGTPLMTYNHPKYRPRTPTLILLPVGNWQSNSHTYLKSRSWGVWAVVVDTEQCRKPFCNPGIWHQFHSHPSLKWFQ